VTYVMAAVGMIGATLAPLRARPTLSIQVASAFTNRLAPSGMGGTALNIRFLERSGVSRTQALASVTLNAVAGLVVHALAFVILLPYFGGLNRDIDPPEDTPILVVLTIGLLLFGIALWVRIVPPHWKDRVRDFRLTSSATLRRPRRLVALIGGSAGLTAAHCVGLWCTLRSVGATTSFADAAIIYLAAAAVGSISPTPGGLGAFEASLVTGLTRVGTAASTAAAAVVLYRVISFWLPVLPGALEFGRLRRRGVI
jgi:uncharacterized membrane protein YbhN (UPF0104 family)